MNQSHEQTQKLKAIGAMASGIAHDFKNLLQPILGFATMGLRKTQETEDLHSYFNGISIAANRARDLVEEILAFSRQDDPELQPMHLQPIIFETLQMLQAAAPSNVKIVKMINEDCGQVKANATCIHQLVMNLATNAIHAMQETGGELKIELKSVDKEPDSVNESDSQTDGYARLSVSDTGAGIPSELQEKIFEPFFTTKTKCNGTGLGLAIVKNIVKSHQGKLELVNRPGEGATFKVFLPLQVNAKSAKNEKVYNPPDSQGKILIVDDEETIISCYLKSLQSCGFYVLGLTDGLEAWNRIKHEPGKFDMVITDIKLPGMCGYELALRILDIRPDMPIILCDYSYESIKRKNLKAVGIKDFLIKPVEEEELFQKIHFHLD